MTGASLARDAIGFEDLLMSEACQGQTPKPGPRATVPAQRRSRVLADRFLGSARAVRQSGAIDVARMIGSPPSRVPRRPGHGAGESVGVPWGT